MVYTIDELKQKIAPIAKKYNISTVYIFGSYARGEADEDSDIDVLIKREGSKIRGWLIGGLYEEMRESLGKDLDLLTVEALEQNNIQSENPCFFERLMKEQVKIYG